MKLNKSLKTLALSGVMAALLLAGCGGGGVTPQESGAFEKSSSVITNVDAVTGSVRVINEGAALEGVRVVVSTLGTVDTSSDGSASFVGADAVRGMVLYNSGEDPTSVATIAVGGSYTFALKNVNFAPASSDVGSSASAASCFNTIDFSLGEVLVEVLGQEGVLHSMKLPVCAVKDQTYAVKIF